MTTRAAIYTRISSDRSGEALGVARQEEDCRRLCKERGWQVLPIYSDNDISAADASKTRPAYQHLLRDIAAGRVDAVVVWAEDRLHRQPIELEEFVKVCDKAGVTQLVTVAGTVDMGTGDGMLVARIKGAVAAEEVRKTRERIRRKKLELAQAGKNSGGGTRPFGFEEDRLTIRESEAQMIREAAQRVINGGTLYSIRKDWNASGTRSVTGKDWSLQAVRNTLIRPRNAGLRQHQGVVIGEAEWDAIIDRDVWEQLVAVLNNPARRQAPASNKYPLRGVLRCGVCKITLTSMPRSGDRNYGCRKDQGGGRCGHVFVSADNIERHLLGIILPLADSSALRYLVQEEDRAGAEEARAIVLENAADEEMLAQMDGDYADRVIPRTTYLVQSDRLRKRIEGRMDRLSDIRGASVLDKFGGNIQENWNEMSADDQRTVVQALVRHVTVKRQTVRVGNKFDPSRITIAWRFDALAKAALGIWDEMSDEEKEQALERENELLTPEERGFVPA